MLEGKIALVTGSTRGIGWCTAKELAGRGALVLLNGRDNSIVAERADQLQLETGGVVQELAFDVREPSAIQKGFQRIFREHKKLDILVNNAGILQDALIGMISSAAIDELVTTNIRGSILCLQEASRLMTRRRQGVIVNLASIVGTNGNAGQSAYSASKAAIVGLTLSAAKELGPKGIRVNAVAPGLIRTAMTAHLSEAVLAKRIEGIGLGRMGEPEEVARVISWLVSEDASYISGQVLGIDGAMVI